MAFIPKLPTWHNLVTVYRMTDGLWAELGLSFGQLYTPLRNQDDEEGGLMYFEFPKAQLPGLQPWVFPRDSFHGVPDVVEFELPGDNGLQAYRVREVRGRWIGFPNEHLMCDLQRLTDAEWSTDTHSPPTTPPAPPPPGPPFEPGTACFRITVTGAGDASLNRTEVLHWNGSYFQGETFATATSPSGFARYTFLATDVGYFVGLQQIGGVPGTHNVASWFLSLGDWDQIADVAFFFNGQSAEVTEDLSVLNVNLEASDCGDVPPPIDCDAAVADVISWDVRFMAPIANGTCTDCGDMVDAVRTALGAAPSWSVASILSACYGTTNIDISYDECEITIVLYTSGEVARWTVDISMWDGVSAIVADPVSNDGSCDFGTLELTANF